MKCLIKSNDLHNHESSKHGKVTLSRNRRTLTSLEMKRNSSWTRDVNERSGHNKIHGKRSGLFSYSECILSYYRTDQNTHCSLGFWRVLVGGRVRVLMKSPWLLHTSMDGEDIFVNGLTATSQRYLQAKKVMEPHRHSMREVSPGGMQRPSTRDRGVLLRTNYTENTDSYTSSNRYWCSEIDSCQRTSGKGA